MINSVQSTASIPETAQGSDENDTETKNTRTENPFTWISKLDNDRIDATFKALGELSGPQFTVKA